MPPHDSMADMQPHFKDEAWEAAREAIIGGGKSEEEAIEILECAVRATLPSALNAINASSVGKLVQLVTASRLILYHEGRVDPMKDDCHYQIKH